MKFLYFDSSSETNLIPKAVFQLMVLIHTSSSLKILSMRYLSFFAPELENDLLQKIHKYVIKLSSLFPD